MSKRSSFGCKMRKRLSDITNTQSHIEDLLQEESHTGIISVSDEDVNRLLKQENWALVKLLEEKDKIIESNSAELQNLREGANKLQVQNWTLAQTNSQFLAEINLARNKVKALHHEIMCKNALLKAKESELQERMKEKSRKPQILVQERKNETTRNTAQAETSHKNAGEDAFKPSETNRRPIARSKSMGPSTVQKTEADKLEAEKKRRRLRRQSVRFKSREDEDSEQLFEIEDIQLTMLDKNMLQDGPTAPMSKPNTPEKEEEEKVGKSGLRAENCALNRSSMGRPLRRAVEKVNSYKEVPMNIKLRRSE